MKILASACRKRPSQFHTFYLSKIHRDFMAGILSPEEFHQQFIKTYQCEITFPQFISIWSGLIGTAKEGMAETVGALAGKYTLSVCSNTDSLHWEIAWKTCSFLNYFDHCFLSYRINLLKPDTAIFRKLLFSLSANPHDCIFIDDSEENIIQAKSLGFCTIYTWESETLLRELRKLNINISQQ